MTRSKRLLELQQMDVQLDERRARLGRIASALADEARLATARHAVEAARAALADVEHRLKRESATRDDVQSHVDREERQLYGGAVRGAKDVQNLQREVAALRRQLALHDDVVLELMLARDEAETLHRSASEALAAAEAEHASEREALTRRHRHVAVEVARIEEERAATVATIAPDVIERYERLRRTKGGRAVSELRDSTCSACGILLPVHLADRVRSGESGVLCSGCGRLLLA